MHFTFRQRCCLTTAAAIVATTATLHSQTPRPEPTFPSVCRSVAALHTSTFLRRSNDSTMTVTTEAAPETAAVQSALDACAATYAADPRRRPLAVELKSESTHNAFLLEPLTIGAGVSLTIPSGVTVFASLDAARYNNPTSPDTANRECGHFNAHNSGCIALLNFTGSNSGVYGFGIIDGRGWAVPQNTDTTGPCAANGTSWWQRTLELNDPNCTAGYKKNQNIPRLISVIGDNFTLYRVTLRNSPFWNALWRPATSAGGLTVWGIKVTTPWNVVNTDGIDVGGPNAYITQSVFGVGDDEIAIEAPSGGTYWRGWSGVLNNVLIDRVTGYGRNGISIGSSIAWDVNGITVQNSNLTTRNISALQRGADWTTNGRTFTDIKNIFGHAVDNAYQLMPSTVFNIRGLNIKTNDFLNEGHPLTVSAIQYANICMQDIVQPITVLPYRPSANATNISRVNDITYRNVHILAPDAQMLYYGEKDNTAYNDDPQSNLIFRNPNPAITYSFTLDNVAFDDQPSHPAYSALGYIDAEYASFTLKGNAYPRNLLDLATHTSSPATDDAHHMHLFLKNTGGSKLGSVTTTHPSSACTFSGSQTPFPFLSVDGYITSAGSIFTHDSDTAHPIQLPSPTLTLSAMVQPAMSMTGFYGYPDYGPRGFFAVAAPAPSVPVAFQLDGAQKGATRPLDSTGLATSDTLTLSPGTVHRLSILYPGDAFYPPVWKTYFVTTR